MSKDFENEESDNENIQFFIIPNGNTEADMLSEFYKKIPDKDINEEIDIKNYNPYKDLEVNDTEFNINTLGKNMPNQGKESDDKILDPDSQKLKTFTSSSPSPKKAQDLKKKSLQRFYYKQYSSKFKLFITEYANTLLRNKLLCGKILKPKISLFKFVAKKKKKDKNKKSSLTMKKMFCFHERKNKKIIKRILSFIKKFDANKKYEYIKIFLSLKIEDAIQKFEESEKFKEFISCKKIIALDKEIKLEIGYSILEKNAYVKMVQMKRDV